MKKPKVPVIVVTNDDGIHARGIVALARALGPLGEVYVVAPESEQSSTSHAITLVRPLRLREHKARWWSLDGTPADCVYVALHYERLLPRPPTVVVSGINMGLNLGSDVFYSGTVAGAREGALRGVPSIAFSMPASESATSCARRAKTIVTRFLAWRADWPRARPPLLNVNFPKGRAKGVRVASLGVRKYEDVVEIRNDPRGRQYLWIGGPSVTHPPMPGSDTEAYEQGYVSVTSLRLDLAQPEDAPIAARVAGLRELSTRRAR